MSMLTVLFEDGSRQNIKVTDGENLLEVLKNHGVDVDAPCNGNGTCGKCRVRLLNGTLSSNESRHLTAEDYFQGWRLACQSQITGDVEILVPGSAAAFRSDIRTADLEKDDSQKIFNQLIDKLKVDGLMNGVAMHLEQVELDPPTLDDTMPDNERLIWALEARFGKKVQLSITAIRNLAQAMRTDDFKIKCLVEERGDVLRVLKVFPDSKYVNFCGVAIDIGTTTVTAVLVDLYNGTILAKASAGNGQIPYGADVINRIIESVKPAGAERLRRAIVFKTLQPMIDKLCHTAGIRILDIYQVVIAGNTTMEHLLLGTYADPIRMEPYIPTFFYLEPFSAKNVLHDLSTAATMYLSPNVGSYVGGDITAGCLASRIWASEEVSLLIDLGTNGELVLGNNEYLLTCACSAGPAFEGGDISCGMRATTGAIEEISVDADTMEPTMSIIGPEGQKPAGLCGSGLLDLIASLFLGGIIDARGKFVKEGNRVKKDEYGTGRYIIAFEEESVDGREIALNEVDIDNFIRAKGAIYSGIRTMMEQVGVTTEDISNVIVAGGIGGGIDFDHAVTIGMLPDVDRSKFHFVGNTSLTGAYAMLVSDDARKKCEELARSMMYVELSNEPSYMDEFVAACFLPHTNKNLFPSVEV